MKVGKSEIQDVVYALALTYLHLTYECSINWWPAQWAQLNTWQNAQQSHDLGHPNHTYYIVRGV